MERELEQMDVIKNGKHCKTLDEAISLVAGKLRLPMQRKAIDCWFCTLSEEDRAKLHEYMILKDGA